MLVPLRRIQVSQTHRERAWTSDRPTKRVLHQKPGATEEPQGGTSIPITHIIIPLFYQGPVSYSSPLTLLI